jgi:hypothetical protein
LITLSAPASFSPIAATIAGMDKVALARLISAREEQRPEFQGEFRSSFSNKARNNMNRAVSRWLLVCLMFCPVAVAAARPVHRVRAPAAQPAASGEAATALGQFKDWGAYARGADDTKVCYALSEPKTKEPASAKRDPIYFLVNNWPARHSKGEPEIVPGYPYKDGSTVTVQIGADRFSFFIKDEGNEGSAWALNPTDQGKLVAVMRNGGMALVTGTSRRGTVTKDTYSLAGAADAMDKAAQACGM